MNRCGLFDVFKESVSNCPAKPKSVINDKPNSIYTGIFYCAAKHAAIKLKYSTDKIESGNKMNIETALTTLEDAYIIKNMIIL
ncbi:hypothetical protein D3C86_1789320 [compost metagenome]